MTEEEAYAVLGLESGASSHDIDLAYETSDKGRDATEAVELLHLLLRTDSLISKNIRIQCWADEVE